jgi:serine/threonine protein kinase
MARLRHPHIVAVYDFLDGDPAALVLEYVAGRTLANLVNTEGRLGASQAVQIVEEIAAALDSAHAQGIIHRDVKPSNILLPKRGPAKLTDFGVAHIDEEAPLTMMGDILGTIEYASPEQVHGNQVPDARSDVYSLAAVAYFALTGVPPFQAADSTTQAQLSVMHRQVFSEPISLRAHRADLSPALDQAVLRGLAKSPEARYPSTGQFAATLRVALGTAGLGAAAASEARIMAFTTRRSGVLIGAVASLLLLSVILLWKTRQPIAPSANPPVHIAKVMPNSLGLDTKSVPVAHPLPNTVPTGVKLTPQSAVSVKAVPKAAVFVKHAPQPVPAAISSRKYVKAANATLVRPAKPTAKLRAALGHPGARRHSLLTASHRSPIRSHSAKPTAGRAWLYVYANQNIAPLSPTAHMVNIRPQSVYVDGRPVPELAAGRWASLPAGAHVISFNTDGRTGFSSRTGVRVNLSPGAHTSKQILLPVISNAGARLAVPLPPPINPENLTAVPTATHIAYTVGWYTVSGWIAAKTPGQKPSLVRATPVWVMVDGNPVPALAQGHWAELPAGHHTVTFQPASGLGAGLKTWDIDLAPQAHLDQKVPLPSALVTNADAPASQVGWYTVSGWIAANAPGEKPNLVRAAPQWVMVDGNPVPALAQGHWAELPAGHHTVTFQPASGLGAGLKTWDIELTPQAHLDQKVPLPSNASSFSASHLSRP